jgi:hypothetical protein
MNDPDKINYVVAYMCGDEPTAEDPGGISEDWLACHTMQECMEELEAISASHDFWKVSICQIIESYESEDKS